MKVRFVFAWYDLWVGVFVDRPKHRVYVFPVPCLGLVVSWRFRDDYTEPLTVAKAPQSRVLTADDLPLITEAVADPGMFVQRGRDYTEPISAWSARAVLKALIGVVIEDPTQQTHAP